MGTNNKINFVETEFRWEFSHAIIGVCTLKATQVWGPGMFMREIGTLQQLMVD